MQHNGHHGNASRSKHNNPVAWKKKILKCLNDLQDLGRYATNRVDKASYPDPGLTVCGHHISLPPSAQDVETIDGVCGPAAFGSVVETQGDETGGGMRGLDASQFQADNPAWGSYLDSTLRNATKKLGMPPGVRAQPSKLLFFKKGCSWKFDADREKTPGVIGTLLVCLPLEHSGGGVCLSRRDHFDYAFDTSEHSRSGLTSIIYHSGLARDFRPLTSGHRLLLVYDIVMTVSSLFPASTRHSSVDRLQSLVTRWRRQFPQTQNLTYLLKDPYDTSELSFDKLEGGDQSGVDSLRPICSRAGAYIFLVNIRNLQVDEDYDPDYCHDWDVDVGLESTCGETHRLRTIVTLDGQVICRSFHVKYDGILGVDTSVESEMEMWFNEVESHDAAVLLVPKHKFSVCLWAGNVDMQAMIDFILQDMNESRDDAYSLKANVGFLMKALDHDDMSNDMALGLLDIAVAFKSGPLYHKAFSVALKIPNRRLDAISKVSRLVQTASSSNPEAEMNWDYWLGALLRGPMNREVTSAYVSHFERLLKTGPIRESFKPWATIVSSEKISARPSQAVTEHKPFLDPIDTRMDDPPRSCSDGEGRGKRKACDELDGHVDRREKTA